jgi:hypothetical protein
MSRLIVSVAALVSSLLTANAAAQADCFSRRPGDPPACEQTQQVQQPPLEFETPEPRTLADRTHVGFAPTGSTLSAGDVQYQVHELFWNRLSVGVTDRLEFGADFAFVAAGVGARLQLTSPQSRFKLTVGVGAFASLGVQGYQGSVAAGYHGDEISIYASGSSFLDDDEDPQNVFLYQAGIAKQTSRRAALAAYVGRLAVVDSNDREVLHAVGGGYKYLGDRWDIDLGALFPVVDNDDIGVVPMVSFTYRN